MGQVQELYHVTPDSLLGVLASSSSLVMGFVFSILDFVFLTEVVFGKD